MLQECIVVLGGFTLGGYSGESNNMLVLTWTPQEGGRLLLLGCAFEPRRSSLVSARHRDTIKETCCVLRLSWLIFSEFVGPYKLQHIVLAQEASGLG